MAGRTGEKDPDRLKKFPQGEKSSMETKKPEQRQASHIRMKPPGKSAPFGKA